LEEQEMAEEIDIKHIARLARLHVDENDIVRFAHDMGGIVAMVEKLPEFDNMTLPLNEKDAMPLREDIAEPSMKREKILQNVPAMEAGCVVVPRIVE
jgi:aspartyl-tRNA(Asn)/glutamyl-tRNA(Gln) amidotransferase subunit C